jgi:serine/threonine protein kinase, bacterial
MSPESLGSRYLLDEVIGRGGMGVVWRGRDRVTQSRYAIKVLRPQYAADPSALTRFVRERTALVTFRHPHVVAVHDMIVEGDRLALVMDLITGGDLSAHRQGQGGTLSPAEAAGLMAQVCDGLAAAHDAGIVHRDLKPANVLLDAGHVWLADFGIARVAGEPSATTTGSILGTVSYLAPEVIAGQEPAASGDVYAVGITLYELLTGEPPFSGHVAAVMHAHLQTPPPRPAGVPDWLWDLISGCLSKNPDDRPAAATLAQALSAEARPEAWAVPTPVRPGRPPAFAGLEPREMTQPPVLPAAPQPAEQAGAHARRTRADGSAASLSAEVVPGERRSRPVRTLAVAAAAVLVCAGAVLAITAYGPFRPAHPVPAGARPVTGSRAAARATQPGDRSTSRPRTSRSAAIRPGAVAQSREAAPRVTGRAPAAGGKPAAPSAAPASSTAGATPQWECSGTAVQPDVLLPKSTRACIEADGSTIRLQGWLQTIPAGLPAIDQEQLELVVSTPAGDIGRYLSPDCSPGTCTYSLDLTERPGTYRVRADLVIGGSDQFQGDLTSYATAS